MREQHLRKELLVDLWLLATSKPRIRHDQVSGAAPVGFHGGRGLGAGSLPAEKLET